MTKIVASISRIRLKHDAEPLTCHERKTFITAGRRANLASHPRQNALGADPDAFLVVNYQDMQVI
jgi:hypothetical protein